MYWYIFAWCAVNYCIMQMVVVIAVPFCCSYIINLYWLWYRVFPLFCCCFNLPSCGLRLFMLFSSAHRRIRLCNNLCDLQMCLQYYIHVYIMCICMVFQKSKSPSHCRDSVRYLTDFQYSFTGTFSSKFTVGAMITKDSPHLP